MTGRFRNHTVQIYEAATIPVLGLLTGTLFALIWSGSFIASKFALPLSPPLWLAAERLVAASLLLLPFVGISAFRVWKTSSWSIRIRITISAVLTQSFYLGAVLYSLHTLPAAFVAVIGSSLPLISIPVAVIMLGERASWREILVTLIAVVSILIVILGADSSPGYDEEFSTFAIALMLVAVLALAIGNALLKPIADVGHLLPLITIQMCIGGLFLAAFATLVEGRPQFNPSAESAAGFVYLVVIGSIAGMWCWIQLLRQFSAIRASAFFLATPIFGIALGYWLLGEVLTPVQLFGTGLLCLMILIRSSLDHGVSLSKKGCSKTQTFKETN